jgi:hypothetical protein
MRREKSMSVKDGETIVVWFSCGAASAVAAKKTIDLYGDRCTIRVVNNPVKEEHPDNQRFLKDVEQWLGITIEQAVNPKFPDASCVEVWDKCKIMSFRTGYAPCTDFLKKKARQNWESLNHHDWMVLGFTAEEKRRSDRFMQTERNNLLPVLIDLNITKADCFQIVNDAGLKLPEIYMLGYPNANCIGCVKATSPTYWNHVRKMHPEQFRERAEQSRRLGVRLVRVKGKRLFLDELDHKARGQAMKDMDFECGIFCMEK